MSDTLTFAAAGPKGPQSLAEMAEDERYIKGRSLINSGKYDAAIEHFQDLLQQTIDATDELSSAAAPVYYQYGASLFLKAEEASSVFADGVADGAADDGDDGEGGGEGGAGGGEGGGDDGDDSGEEEEDEDDAVASAVRDTVHANKELVEEMEIAWEVLEVARNILAPMADDLQARDLLARAHLKLGDVQKLNGQFSGALRDYGQCLALRLTLPGASYARGVADVHYQLAQAAEYAANEDADPNAANAPNDANADGDAAAGGGGGGGGDEAVETAAQAALRHTSLHHYERCCAVFQALAAHLQQATAATCIGAASGSGGASAAAPLALDGGSGAPRSAEDAAELAEVQEIVDELAETIAALKDGSGRVDKRSIASAVAAQPAGPRGGQAAAAAPAGLGLASGVTTIGFGGPSAASSASASAFGGTASAFGSAPSCSAFSAAPSSSSSSSSAAAAPLMVTKKKKKAPASAEADAKKPKAE